MKFVDVSQYKIVNMNKFATLKIKLDGDKYLDSPISESSNYLHEKMRCHFKTPSVVYEVVVTLVNPTIDDFEVICENVVSAVFANNMDEQKVRTDEEKKYVLNKLPSNRWVLKPYFANQVHCDTTTLLRAAQVGWRNRNINIFIRTSDDQFKYELIGEAE